MINGLDSLLILFMCAIIGGAIATKMKQPVAIGLLLVGAVLGPNALNLVNDAEIINFMSELGAILLLFVIGMEFIVPKLVKIGSRALLMTFLKLGIIIFLTYEILTLLGFGKTVALVLGVLISVSSTVVIIKILESKGLYNRDEMPLIIAILIFEDIFSVFVLTLLSNVNKNSGALLIFEQLIFSITVLFLAYFLMLKLSKPMVNFFLNNGGEDVSVFIALGMCAGFSALAYVLGLSPSIGAFLAGSIIASLPNSKMFEHSIRPYSVIFTSLLFISIGTMVNFNVIREYASLILLLIGLVIATRVIGVGLVGQLLSNFRKEQVIFSSIAMLAVSEFSLLIAHSAKALNLGIDLISITAILIFVTAIILSVSIGYYESFFNIVDGLLPKNWKTSSRNVSDYIRLSFDEIDTESRHSRRFKKNLGDCIMCIILAILTVIGWRKLNWLAIKYSTHISYANLMPYILGAISLSLIVFLIIRAYKKGKDANETIVMILTNIDTSRNLLRSKVIFSNLLILLVIIMLVFLTPLIIVVFNLSDMVNLLPVGLLAIFYIYIKRTTEVIHHFHSDRRKGFPKYRKLNAVDE